DYNEGGNIIKFFLHPPTIPFPIPLYKHTPFLKKYSWQILSPIFVPSLSSITILYLLPKPIHLHPTLIKTMLPQAPTTPIALPI
ncbi:LrgB family protein, partial [Bacillus sp. WP8]|uniref:LrgB family protein n=1 Tax=Bacillus sp. WP8 TaxID=756828 RepID=UPI00164325F9